MNGTDPLFAAGEFLWKQIHNCVRKFPLLGPYPGRFCPVLILTACFFQVVTCGMKRGILSCEEAPRHEGIKVKLRTFLSSVLGVVYLL